MPDEGAEMVEWGDQGVVNIEINEGVEPEKKNETIGQPQINHYEAIKEEKQNRWTSLRR